MIKVSDEDKLILAAWVLRSDYRARIIDVLSQHTTIPTRIAKESGIDKHHVSNILKDLKGKGLVKCLNESEVRGRLYSLTRKGKEVYSYVEELRL